MAANALPADAAQETIDNAAAQLRNALESPEQKNV